MFCHSNLSGEMNLIFWRVKFVSVLFFGLFIQLSSLPFIQIFRSFESTWYRFSLPFSITYSVCLCVRECSLWMKVHAKRSFVIILSSLHSFRPLCICVCMWVLLCFFSNFNNFTIESKTFCHFFLFSSSS